MFLTRKEIRQHIEAIAYEMSCCTNDADVECNCEYSDRIDSHIAELYNLAEDIWPTCTEDTDEDAIREAVRESQYANRW